MSHVYVDATIRGSRRKKIRFMVDTGATYCLVSPEIARKTGLLATRRKQKVRLANGKTVQVPVFAGEIRVEDREAMTFFWVGQCHQPLLGAETLEVLGLAVDPARGRLKPTRRDALLLCTFDGRR